MSDTPRTDALIKKLDANHNVAIAFVWRQMVNHARRMERKLAKLEEKDRAGKRAMNIIHRAALLIDKEKK